MNFENLSTTGNLNQRQCKLTTSISAVQFDHVIMDKDAKGKGKGKTYTFRVKSGKCSAEEQDVKESTHQPRAFVAFGKFYFSLLDKMKLFLSSLARTCFFKPRAFFCFRFFHRSNRKKLPRGNFCA